MNETRLTIAKNASYLMVSQVITWGFALLYTIVLPRYLGAIGIGKIVLANSIWAIAIIVMTFGMDIMLAKEIARNPAKTSKLVSISVLLRSLLFILGIGAVVLYARLSGFPQETQKILYIIGISSLITLWSGVTRSALQGLERMEYISLSEIGSKVFLTVASIVLVSLGFGLIPVIIVFVSASLVGFLIQFIGLYRIVQFRLYFNLPEAWWMLKSGIPYLTSTVFLVLYMQIDVIIIARLVSEQAVGWYAVASRLFGTFLFIPSVFITALLPALSRMFANSSESLPKVMSKSFDLLLMIGVPIGLGILAVANPIVILLYGKGFANSGPILAGMGIVLILTYQTMLLGYFCISTDKQKTWSIVMVFATLATVPLDLILVPWCQKYFGNGAIGGSLSFIITEAGMILVGLFLLPKKTLGWANLWLGGRVLLAGLLMVLSVWSLRDYFIVLPILAGALTYLVSIIAFRVIPTEYWILLMHLTRLALIRLRLLKTPTVILEERK